MTDSSEERDQDVRTSDLTTYHLPVEKAFGVQWAVESDMLGFRIILRSHEEASCPPYVPCAILWE